MVREEDDERTLVEDLPCREQRRLGSGKILLEDSCKGSLGKDA